MASERLNVAYSSYEDLDDWKRGGRIAVRIYEILKDCRDYALKDQMTRAAVSMPSAIAEGTERDSRAEFIRFLHIARRKRIGELRTQLYIAQENNVLAMEDKEALIQELKTISSKLHSLIKSLKSKLPVT